MHFLEDFRQIRCFFGSRTVFLGQEVHYYMANIAFCLGQGLKETFGLGITSLSFERDLVHNGRKDLMLI